MLNKLLRCIRRYELITPGERIVCAVSGGADSMALLWAMYLLQDKLQIQVVAAHVNHGLRGEESDREEDFVRKFCEGYHIPFYSQKVSVQAGKKGLEAAAREARYGYLQSLPGKVATAHTANDNAETVLMHMVRGTGLKGLGGISPVKPGVIRPMLTVTREEVLAFLGEYHIQHVTDSSNASDCFLRNRLRHHVMPLLEQENPRLAEDISAMAMGLREDEAELEQQAQPVCDVEKLKAMSSPRRSRCLLAFLKECHVPEPERQHVALVESLVFSQNPSAKANLPGGITVAREYDRLCVLEHNDGIKEVILPCPGTVVLENLQLRVICSENLSIPGSFQVQPNGQMVVRSRRAGDRIRLAGGTKSLKKLFIDRKIPVSERDRIPIIADDTGVLGVYNIGPNLDRVTQDGLGVNILFEQLSKER